MIAAKETAVSELGEMGSHVIEDMAPKEDVADIKTEMMEQLDQCRKTIWRN